MVAAPVSYVEVNGARLAYREFGTSNEKPLILIMGYTGVMDRWDGAFVYSLAEEYHVYIYDHRGMGYSTDNGTQYELRQLADDCVALMGALGHDTFYVAGHSMGSIITQILVAEYPGHIEKAVIISTIPTINYPGAEVIKGKIVFAADNKDLVGDGIYRESLALISYTGVYDQLKNVTTDVLVVVGTADEVTPQQGSVDVAGEIDGAWLVRFKECSHRIWAEVPLRVSGTIKYYLAMDETYSP